MGKVTRYAAMAGFLTMAASVPAAQAADLLAPPMMPEPYEFPVAGGWYLRGDVGFSNQSIDRFTNPVAPADTLVLQKGFDAAPLAGAGVGYKFNDWLRADLTGEYRARANFHGLDRYTDPFSTSGTGFATNEYYASKSEIVGLANIYFDLGTWHGFTPFVGGGVGVSHNTIHDWRDTNVPTGSVAFGRTTSVTNFAWAAHAGVAYAVSPNFSVEFAYRYIHLGDGRAPAVFTYLGEFGAPRTRLRDIESHDFKVGLRFMLGDMGGYEHPPLMRRN